MNKIILSLCIICFSTTAFSQTETDSIPVTKEDYLKKSKNQKTAAWILLGTGVVLDIAGIVTTGNNADKELGNLFSSKQSVNHTGEYILYITGTAALAGSLTLFIAAKRNKKKALSTSFEINNQQLQQLKNNSLYTFNYPVLTFKLRF
ncbi:MAG: hypothetical protein KF825_02305 [Ferruginibacter sp.]|nr:hypothetical protein [Ferruginibacter sp.]